MELPQGNPYKDLLDKRLNDEISQEQMDIEIAKDVALKDYLYIYEQIPPKPQKLVDFYTLSEEKQEKIWRNLQNDHEVKNYHRIIDNQSRNKYALAYYANCLKNEPIEQQKLIQRLNVYKNRGLSTEEAEEVTKLWGGSLID